MFSICWCLSTTGFAAWCDSAAPTSRSATNGAENAAMMAPRVAAPLDTTDGSVGRRTGGPHASPSGSSTAGRPSLLLAAAGRARNAP